MKWLADECVDAGLVAQLRMAGHDVDYLVETARGGTDVDAMERASAANRVILTEDKDFGELVFRRGRRAPGIVLVRIDPERRARKWPRLRLALDTYGQSLFGRYTVVEEARIRSRPLLAIREDSSGPHERRDGS